MKKTNHLIAQVRNGAVVDSFYVETDFTQDLDDKEIYQQIYDNLIVKFPDKDIKLEKHNFNYISNFGHWSAAGYDCHIVGYQTGRAPAHFNPEFFHALTSTSILK